MAIVGGDRLQQRRAGTRRETAQDLAAKLSSYYPSVVNQARALGTSRDTVRAWRDDAPDKPREDILRRAERLWILCRSAQRYMEGEQAIGTWTLSPHLGLAGKSPAAHLVEHGETGLVELLADMATYTPPRRDVPLDVGDEEIWEGVKELLGANGLTRGIDMEAAELDVTDEDLADLEPLD